MNLTLVLAVILAVTPVEKPETLSTTVSQESEALFESVSDSWKESSFACDYELTAGSIGGFVNSDKEPLTREELHRRHPDLIHFDDVDLSATPIEMYEVSFRHRPSRGRICKRGDLVFVSDVPATTPSMTTTPDSPQSGLAPRPAMNNIYVEGMANREMQIQYYHDGQQTNVGRVGLTKRDPENECGFPDPMVSPISPKQSCSNYGRYYMSNDPPLSESFTDLGNSRLLVERIWERTVEDYSIRCYSDVIFNNAYDRPTIESIKQRIHKIASDGTDGELRGFDRVVLLDHINCGDGIFLAKRVVRARMVNAKPPIMITEWKSANLGERPPRDSDFVIQVKGNDDTIGFKNSQQRIFTFADLDMNKQQQPGGIVWGPQGDPSQPPPGPPKVLVPRAWWLSLLIWANLIGLPLLAIYLVRRLRRSANTNP